MNWMFVTPNNIDGQRISYEYVVQRYKIQQLLQGQHLISLKNICKYITSGIRMKKEYYINNNGYRIITPGDIRNEVIYPNELKKVQPYIIKERFIINIGDVLITASGKSGQVIYVNETLEGCTITSDIIRISLKDGVDGKSLCTFLKSNVGQMLLNSIKVGVLNKISVEGIENLLIPEEFEKTNKCYCENDSKYHLAEKFYKSAENIFYKIIDYKNEEEYFKFFTVKKYLDCNRLDPIYYTNFYTILYKLIQNDTVEVKWQELKEVVVIKLAEKPDIDEKQKIRYFQLSDIDTKFSIIKSTHQELYGNLSNRMRYIVRGGEIVTAKGGSATGTRGHATAFVTEEFDGMVTTDALYNLIPMGIDPYYLLFIFKQPVVLNQINMFTKGTTYKLLQRDDLEKIKIPRLTINTEHLIAEKIRLVLDSLKG